MRFLNFTALTLTASLALSACTPPRQHPPPRQYGAISMPAAASAPALQQHLDAMRDIHNKMLQARTSAERVALAPAHTRAMRDGLAALQRWRAQAQERTASTPTAMGHGRMGGAGPKGVGQAAGQMGASGGQSAMGSGHMAQGGMQHGGMGSHCMGPQCMGPGHMGAPGQPADGGGHIHQQPAATPTGQELALMQMALEMLAYRVDMLSGAVK